MNAESKRAVSTPGDARTFDRQGGNLASGVERGPGGGSSVPFHVDTE